MAMWLKFSGIGERWQHEGRLRESCLQHSCVVPPMYLLHKSHKAWKPGDLPATHPVVSGWSGIGVPLSNMVSDYVENIANMKVDPLEIISTEDLLSRVNDHNQKVAEVDPDTKTVLGGCDAVALFPSMTSRETGRAVREATIKIIKESGL